MTMTNEAFEAWWTESPQNLSKAALGSPECELHRRTWQAATERAAKQDLTPLYSTRMKTKRYDWLLKHHSTCIAGDDMNPAVARVSFERFYLGSIGARPSLDGAIDDAIAAAIRPGGELT